MRNTRSPWLKIAHFDTVCFHAQQCVEKYLKGWLAFRATDVPRSHDLVLLLNLGLAVGLRGISAQEVQPLNRYTIEARYLGGLGPYRSARG